MNLQFIRKLNIPMELKEQFPLSDNLRKIISDRDIELKNILSGKDKRFLLIVGPCSADNVDSILDYTVRLREVYEKVKDKIMIIPRIYTSKPRTKLSEYKGLLHQPDPKGKEDMWEGLIKVRGLHMKITKETGMNGADELLYTENYKYIDDIVCYLAVGARSVEDQEHRLTASGVSIPVGMKNPITGDLNVVLNSVVAAQTKHTFLYRGWEVKSDGNPYAHVVLRGYTDKFGKSYPNYKYEDLTYLNDLYKKFNVQNKAVIVDCNHANSDKKPLLQIDIARSVLYSRNKNKDLKTLVKGLMIESYIEEGRQEIIDSVYGKSITDPCLGFEKTKELILEIADTI